MEKSRHPGDRAFKHRSPGCCSIMFCLGIHQEWQGKAVWKKQGEIVRFIRVLLSLYSIQLIVISALLITYLTVTAGNRTEAQRGNTLATVREGLYSIVTGLEARGGDGGIRTATSPLFTIKGELEALRSLEATPNPGETIGISDVKLAPEKRVNGSGTDSVIRR